MRVRLTTHHDRIAFAYRTLERAFIRRSVIYLNTVNTIHLAGYLTATQVGVQTRFGDDLSVDLEFRTRTEWDRRPFRVVGGRDKDNSIETIATVLVH